MKCVLNFPNYGEFSNFNFLKKMAKVAESSGWDGLFIWDRPKKK